uniref:pentatricopeptide repeat-containing protein At1g63330-like n=1 Tax=Erigeron canadensis TaxID=72917 RepID=UPI001CB8B8CB|nr:pentatricopeptide repeat-containing protein At1g63330-like [Erigeron canadensis]
MTLDAEEIFAYFIINDLLCEPNLATYKNMIEGLCKVGSQYAAIRLLRLLDYRGVGGDCKFDVVMYNIVLDSLCKDVVVVGDVFKLFNDMVFRKAIPPNVHTYKSLIYNLSKFGRWDDVCLMLRRMVKKNIHPDVTNFNIIVDALCKQGKINEAQAVIDIMDETGGKYTPDVVTYNSLIEAYGWKREMREARRIFDTLASKCIKPNSDTYNKLMLGYIWDSDIQKFLKLYNLSYDGRLLDSVWFALPYKFNYLQRLIFGKYKDAVALFHLMDGSGINSDANVHMTLIRRAIKCRKFDDARRFFHDLLVADISEHKQKQREAVVIKYFLGNPDRAFRLVDLEVWFPRVKLYLDM